MEMQFQEKVWWLEFPIRGILSLKGNKNEIVILLIITLE